MANILLTQRCVRACPYCFAKDRPDVSNPDAFLSWDNLIYIADFMEASGEKAVSILGGEPTLHPQFLDYILYLIERHFTVTVFTSGIMANESLEKSKFYLKEIPVDSLRFVCNLNDPEAESTPFAEIESIKNFLNCFGARTYAGFTIYRTDFKLDFLIDTICEFGMIRNVRIGLALPIVGGSNAHISIEQIDEVIESLFLYKHLFERFKIRPGLDCGFPMCRFSDEQLGWLYRFTGGASRFYCGLALDIGPDMMVWPCFPLSNYHKRSLFEFNSFKEVIFFYKQMLEKIRVEVGGIYESCDTCQQREDGICGGGCAAHILNHFRNEAPVRLIEVYG